MNTLRFLLDFISILFQLLNLLIIARVLLSWFRAPGASGPIVRFIIETTEPILGTVRKIMPRTGVIDFSPIIALIGLQILERLLVFIITGS
ncbi:YggT family protein [Candidatus Peregrinibacteria bacterium]|nr:YggT family protein [Candidatus Peregrinibacteria bacterium]